MTWHDDVKRLVSFQVDLTKFCSLLEHRRGVTATARTLNGKHALAAEMGLRDLSPRRCGGWLTEESVRLLVACVLRHKKTLLDFPREKKQKDGSTAV